MHPIGSLDILDGRYEKEKAIALWDGKTVFRMPSIKMLPGLGSPEG